MVSVHERVPFQTEFCNTKVRNWKPKTWFFQYFIGFWQKDKHDSVGEQRQNNQRVLLKQSLRFYTFWRNISNFYGIKRKCNLKAKFYVLTQLFINHKNI